jgi:signal transduction histidine kinase
MLRVMARPGWTAAGTLNLKCRNLGQIRSIRDCYWRDFVSREADNRVWQGMAPSDQLTPDELAKLELFRSVAVEELQPLVQNCEVRSIPGGAILIEADQPNDRLYLVLSGEVGVHLGSPASAPIVTLGVGETVGELSLIDKGPTSAFVVAHEPTRVLVLSEATMWALVTASHAISLNLLRTLSTRLRRDNRLIDEHREQLRQAQKLEALGQLTGGIAHDFNNLLSLAMVDLEMIGALADEQTRIAKLAEEAHAVLQNGAELTERLLTFARRQRLEARLVDVNAMVAATGELLRRSLGQAIRLETALAGDRCQAWVDPTQLQNALLNLAFNARDAMPEGGTLTITTESRPAIEADQHAGVGPGTFVLVSVADTGHGMAPEILEHAFEPLFTTKQAGGGTGLGLSIVYGFAKQSGGHVTIRSEVRRGTTVTLYLPDADVGARRHETPGAAPVAQPSRDPWRTRPRPARLTAAARSGPRAGSPGRGST